MACVADLPLVMYQTCCLDMAGYLMLDGHESPTRPWRFCPWCAHDFRPSEGDA